MSAAGIVFELCAETLQACEAAREGGVQRIELCSALSIGGLTPSYALIEAAVAQAGLPVHVLLRPRAGGFVYSAAEFALMEADLRQARRLGASGFVAGVLDASGCVHIERMRRLVELAEGLPVSFHRAFDVASELSAALEAVIASGCVRVLSSGGAVDVERGAERLRELDRQSSGRIVIAAGGGLRVANAARVAAVSGLRDFHGSVQGAAESDVGVAAGFGEQRWVRAEDVRAMVAELALGAAG